MKSHFQTIVPVGKFNARKVKLKWIAIGQVSTDKPPIQPSAIFSHLAIGIPKAGGRCTFFVYNDIVLQDCKINVTTMCDRKDVGLCCCQCLFSLLIILVNIQALNRQIIIVDIQTESAGLDTKFSRPCNSRIKIIIPESIVVTISIIVISNLRDFVIDNLCSYLT